MRNFGIAVIFCGSPLSNHGRGNEGGWSGDALIGGLFRTAFHAAHAR